MPIPRVRISYQDYLQLPEDQRYEVLEGDLRMVPAPGPFHQRVVAKMERMLSAFAEPGGLGLVYFAPIDVILDEHTVVQPDILLVVTERLSIIGHDGVQGAPDLVVEVFSPGTAHRDRGVKRRLYGRYGVQEYWLVDPQERTVEVACQRDGALETVGVASAGMRVQSRLLPDFVLAVDDLFN